MGYIDPQCVCKKCEATCKAEEDFFEHHLKVLCKGTEVYIFIITFYNVVLKDRILI